MGEIDYGWVYRLFFKEGEVVEVRAKGIVGKDPAWKNEYARKNSIIYGYFDNEQNFAKAVESLDSFEAEAIWFTANPPKKACLSRSPNELEIYDHNRSKQTSANDIRCIRWLMIDIDPKGDEHVSGVASTQKELDYGHKAGQAVVSWLRDEFKFEGHIGGMSGNGYHIWFRLNDLDVSDDIGKKDGLLHKALCAINMKFPAEKFNVEIDTSVVKIAQLGKLYGTMSRKGKHTEDRPHRQSHLFSNTVKSLDEVPVLDLRKLKSLVKFYDDAKAAEAGPAAPASNVPAVGKTTRMPSDSLGSLDVKKYLEYHGWDLYKEENKGHGMSYGLEKCPFGENHKRDAEIFVYNDGKITFNCFHDSCKGYKWQDVKQLLSGSEKLTEFMTGYDPNWKPDTKTKKKTKPAVVLSEYADDLSQLSFINQMEVYDSALVKPPHVIDPDSFFKVNAASGRKEMIQDWAASYLAAYLHPIAWTDGMYYKYENGIWDRFEEEKVESVLITAMGELIKGNYIDSVKKIFKGKVRRSEKDWPAMPDLINVKNGMVDMTTDKLELIDHDHKYGSRIQLNVSYDMDAECNRWERFLQEIFPEPDGVGESKRQLVQDFMAYCIMTTCKFEKCLFCYGIGGNGKSTVIDTLSQVVGIHNTCRVNLDQLSERFSIPALQHKLVNLCTESSKKQVATDVLKAAISGEIIAGEHKHSSRVEFNNTAKFIFGMNEPPGITDRTPGFERRVLVLEFNQDFEKSPSKDVDLRDYLREKELDGIFMWMLHSVNRLILNKGFVMSDQAKKDHARFMKNINNVLQFVEERCVVEPDNEECNVSCAKFHMEFTNWCKAAQYKPWGKHRFYEQVVMINGVDKSRRKIGPNRYWAFTGIDLTDEIDDNLAGGPSSAV